MILDKKASGILLHPSSLPGDYGIGEIGKEALAFIDRLADMGQRYWQMLPLNPIGAGASPYSSPAGSACNDLLISMDGLVADGLLTDDEVSPLKAFPRGRADFKALMALKPALLDLASDRFIASAPESLKKDYNDFVALHDQRWLHDYALYSALHLANGYVSWTEWGDGLARRDKDAMERAEKDHAIIIERLKVRQFLFDRQWQQLRDYAADKDIQLIGDIPIFVSHDSSDVWANQHMFKLDTHGKPTVVAGVPPDIFSQTGQRWGNPHYDWDAMARDGFNWWKQRIERLKQLADIIRIDHFLAFSSAWEIGAAEPTAINGHWTPAPGHQLFQAFLDHFGKLPLIAEDLGLITEEVIALRKAFDIPGLHVLQFDIEESDKDPRHYPAESVTYTGTHDNNTTLGWFRNEGLAAKPSAEGIAMQAQVLERLGGDGNDMNWRLIDYAMQGASNLVLMPLQDVLDLGAEARMNVPGTAEGNWDWRFTWDQLTTARINKLQQMTINWERGRSK